MKEYLKHPIFNIISELSNKLGIETYVIGGFVRDIFLKRPSKDVDILVIGNGPEFALEVGKKLHTNVSVFKNFGTAMLRYQDLEVEFVGARKESYRTNSRKPIVENGTLEDDQKRRDFTINAMAISLSKNNYGQLIDPFNGVKDLKENLIITPLDANETFSDDPLRMMRAIRFATQLNFQIHQSAIDAIVFNKERIKIVSKERITDELNKIILSKKPSIGFKYLFDTKLLHIIFPQMAKLYGIDYIDGKGHKDNFYHTLQVLDNLSQNTDDLWLRWAAILHDIAKPATKRFEKNMAGRFMVMKTKGPEWFPKYLRSLNSHLTRR